VKKNVVSEANLASKYSLSQHAFSDVSGGVRFISFAWQQLFRATWKDIDAALARVL
jgi:hypothetical protein